MRDRVAKIPEEPPSRDTKSLKEYIKSVHPRYDWRDCVDFLIEIQEETIKKENSTDDEFPTTGQLNDALGVSRGKVIRFLESVEPRYVRVQKSRITVIIGGKRFNDYFDQVSAFKNVQYELKDFLDEDAPDIVEEDMLEELNNLYQEIEYLMEQEDIFGVERVYRKLIQNLNSAGVDHNLHDIVVDVDRSPANRSFIIVAGKSHFNPFDMRAAFRGALNDLDDFLQNDAPIVSPRLLGDLRFRRSEIGSLMKEGKLFRAVGKYNELIQKLNNNGVYHNLPDAYIRSTAYRYVLTASGKSIISALKEKGFIRAAAS